MTHHAVISCSFIILRCEELFLFSWSLTAHVNSKYHLKGLIYIWHLLAFAGIRLFKWNSWGKKKAGFGMAMKKVWDMGFLWKRSRNSGMQDQEPPSSPPPPPPPFQTLSKPWLLILIDWNCRVTFSLTLFIWSPAHQDTAPVRLPCKSRYLPGKENDV